MHKVLGSYLRQTKTPSGAYMALTEGRSTHYPKSALFGIGSKPRGLGALVALASLLFYGLECSKTLI